jgi:hypothetical protein
MRDIDRDFSWRVDGSAWWWLGLGLLLAWGLNAFHDGQITHVVSIHELLSLPLPAHVVFPAEVKSIRSTASAWTLELDNQGSISCYWRHPPQPFFLFAHDRVRIEAELQLTPTGKFCSVRGITHVD